MFEIWFVFMEGDKFLEVVYVDYIGLGWIDCSGLIVFGCVMDVNFVLGVVFVDIGLFIFGFC